MPLHFKSTIFFLCGEIWFTCLMMSYKAEVILFKWRLHLRMLIETLLSVRWVEKVLCEPVCALVRWNLVFSITTWESHHNTACVRNPLLAVKLSYILAYWVIWYPNKVDLCFMLEFVLRRIRHRQGVLGLRSQFCGTFLSALEGYTTNWGVPPLVYWME